MSLVFCRVNVQFSMHSIDHIGSICILYEIDLANASEKTNKFMILNSVFYVRVVTFNVFSQFFYTHTKKKPVIFAKFVARKTLKRFRCGCCCSAYKFACAINFCSINLTHLIERTKLALNLLNLFFLVSTFDSLLNAFWSILFPVVMLESDINLNAVCSNCLLQSYFGKFLQWNTHKKKEIVNYNGNHLILM